MAKEDTIQQLQLLDQNMNHLLEQKSELQDEIQEIESALRDFNETKTSYRIVGKLMIAQDSKQTKAQLEEKKSITTLKLTTLDTQEQKIKEKIQKVQEELMQAVKEE